MTMASFAEEDSNAATTAAAAAAVTSSENFAADRIITKVASCLKRKFGPVRMVGTVDIDGYGTSHNIPGVETDPFVLSDYVSALQ